MDTKTRTELAANIYLDAIANGGSSEFNALFEKLNEVLPNNQKTLAYQFLAEAIILTVEKASELGALRS